MTIANNLMRMLDRKQWEMCNYAPTSSNTGSYVVSSNLIDQYQYFVTSTTSVYCYDPFEDGWMTIPSAGLAGTHGAGSCGVRHPWGPRGFATAGTTTTLTTNINLQRSLKGYKVRIIAGPNAGNDLTIDSNTTGANSVITFQETMGTAFTTASEYILFTGRLWCISGASTATGSFKYYDLATNTWYNAGAPSPASMGTDAKLVATPGILEDFITGTASSATSSTLVHAGKNWSTNQWANYQIRITSGQGAGQFRPIASNTSNTVTVSSAWTTTPNATSQYVIEGNSDVIYLLGNNSTTMYKYSITAGTWSTVTPVANRTGAPGAGMSAHYVYGVTDSSWKVENGSGFLNGRYIYSFRGANTVTVDRYDIALNTWESNIDYSPKNETFNTGASYCLVGDYLYVMQNSPTGKILKYNIAQQRIEPVSQLWYGQGTTVLGDRLFDTYVSDGTTTLRWLYYITHSQNILFRMMII